MVPVVIVFVLIPAFLIIAGPQPHGYVIPSHANEPTLIPGDRVVKTGHGRIGRGDIVVFQVPAGGSTRILRVVAVGGDRVSEGTNGRLDLNGQPDVEPYLAHGTTTEHVPDVVIPFGSVFLMGDNRGNSSDSRYYGPVPLQGVVGRYSGTGL